MDWVATAPVISKENKLGTVLERVAGNSGFLFITGHIKSADDVLIENSNSLLKFVT
jgi:hypothetical protein